MICNAQKIYYIVFMQSLVQKENCIYVFSTVDFGKNCVGFFFNSFKYISHELRSSSKDDNDCRILI